MTTIHNGDCIETMKAMPPESVDAIVTDPPYGLSNTTPAQVADTITKWAGGDRDHVPTGRGFMGKSWDAFVPPPAVWDECLRVLKPGGHMLVFAGSRTQDLMGLSIRLAGFELRESLAWLYGSGFPKSHDVGKAIGRLAGAEREVTRFAEVGIASGGNNAVGGRKYVVGIGDTPVTPDAQQWDGWGTALKPGHEPVVLARKPLAEKTVARNVLAHGTGAINVDACRIDATGRPLRESRSEPSVSTFGDGLNGSKAAGSTDQGRWPANVLLDQHAAAWVDEQSGVTKSSVRPATGGPIFKSSQSLKGGGGQVGIGDRGHADQGGASRFFYTAKAPKRERPSYTTEDGQTVQHSTVKPLAIMRWLLRLVTPPGGTVLDPFAGSGTTIEAALIEGFNPIGIEMETDYLPLIQQRIDRQAAQLGI